MAADPSPEFQDWELLANSDSPNPDDHLEETEADSEGVFSLDDDNRFAKPDSEEASVESGNSSWVDPGPDYETRYQTKHATELWSDSGSDRSAEHELRDFDDNEKTEIDFSGTGETSGKEGESDSCDCTLGNVEGKIEMGFDETVKSFEEFAGNQGADKDLSNFWSDPGGGILVLSDVEKMTEDAVVLAESESGGTFEEANSSAFTVGERGGCDEEKRKLVWWKVPFELLKYCAFRISPVWTFSMAVAVLGFVILGRRLYKMKRKARSLQLKVTVDDKKVSQLASRAARMNESFSVVRRVPLVRPLLPAASGVYSWPVFNFR